ncbi:uncharacterized protein LOC111321951 [Stylophora pistillata]|uniref:uncharacterized protein LOC111321951 n=1 Tax=Stylophora pistillata TaxID=50429 RepID=UPI000C046393|nr:uncharacterized protein LOC111321951 [Stylophora pistillata]
MQNSVVFFTLLLLLTGLIAASKTKYEVYIFTGNKFGAGTDARVFITLFGEKGHSKEIELESKGRNDFEKGQKDKFVIETKYLGKLNAINIRHDNSWFGSGWYLDKVKIKATDGCVYEFVSHKWLASNVGDGKISRELNGKSRCPSLDTPTKDCQEALGISRGMIKDSQFTASSSYDEHHQPYHARLNKTVKGSRGGWCSAFADETEFLEIDLGNKTGISGISTQGQSMFDNWVTRYAMSYSINGKHWLMVTEGRKRDSSPRNFTGNKDRDSVVTHWFPRLIARYVRVLPLTWSGLTNCMRIELFGCRNVTSPDEEKKEKEKIAKANKESESQGENDDSDTMKMKGKLSEEDLSIMSTIEKAVVYLRFEYILKDNIIVDESQFHNDAKIVNFAKTAQFSERCGNGVDLNGGDILLNGPSFKQKPRVAVTIAAWIKLFSVDGTNSLFDTIGGVNSSHDNGQYHLEIDSGSVRWFHRNERGQIIFNVTSEVIVPSHVWTHVACTYEAKLGQADIYVNAKFVLRGDGSGELSQDWQEKAGIGEHKGERLFDGQIDEFYMSNEALSQEEIKKLMQRCEFEKECFSPLGMEDMKIRDGQITASSTYHVHKPYYGRLNLVSFYDDPQRTAWCADEDDKEPYLTVDLREEKTLSGVALQGASLADNYVTSFKLCYSQNGRTFQCVTEDLTGESLQGSDDKDSVKIHWLQRFFDGRYIRIYPLSWYGDHICMRVELYGCIPGLLSDTVQADSSAIEIVNPLTSWSNFGDCSVSCGKGTKKRVVKCQPKGNERNQNCPPGTESYTEKVPCTRPSCPECFSPMGMSNGTILDHEISGSSTIDKAHPAFYARVITARNERVSTRGSWCAKLADKEQYLEIDLKKPRKVTGIGTQGQVSDERWVVRYRITYSANGLKWTNYTEDNRQKIFVGNDDSKTIAVRHLRHPITARYVRIHPQAWYGVHICMRAELYGCDHLGQSFKPVEVTDNSESSFKVADETGASKANSKLHAKAEASPKGKSAAVGTGAVTEEHAGGKATMFPSLVISKSGGKAAQFNKYAPRPYHVQTKISNAENQNSYHLVTGLPTRPHAHPELPLPVSNTSKQTSILNKQQVNDLQSSKTSTIHNHGQFEWGAFSKCSVTCGSGIRKRYRRCNVEQCTAPGMETQIIPCVSATCSADALSWSPYTECSVTCGVGKRTRSRMCDGVACPRSGQEFETISCFRPGCPVLHLGFEKWENQVVLDESEKGNNAFLDKGAFIAPHRGVCGHYASLGKSGDILLEDKTFRGKPSAGITVASWVNLVGTTLGFHSVFSTARVMNIGQIMGGYHFEIDDGKVRWFHRNRFQNPVFSVITDNIVKPDVWTHLIGSYNSTSGEAKVYVNGALSGTSRGYGALDDFWGYKACVGSFDLGGRYLRGFVDDFYIFNYAIEPDQIKDLLRIKCPEREIS